jgi:hypothetical protein
MVRTTKYACEHGLKVADTIGAFWLACQLTLVKVLRFLWSPLRLFGCRGVLLVVCWDVTSV